MLLNIDETECVRRHLLPNRFDNIFGQLCAGNEMSVTNNTKILLVVAYIEENMSSCVTRYPHYML